MRCVVEVSAGELVDRISILEIKVQRLPPERAQEAAKNLKCAREAKERALAPTAALESLCARLAKVNRDLWSAEEALREHQQHRRFDAAFVALARSVCENNDLRAALKREVDRLVGSDLGEQKSYALPEL